MRHTPSPCWSASITTKAATFSSKRSSSAPSSRPSIFRMSCELRCSTFDWRIWRGSPGSFELICIVYIYILIYRRIYTTTKQKKADVSLLISKKSHTSEILPGKESSRVNPLKAIHWAYCRTSSVSTQEPNPVPQWKRKGWTPGPSATSEMPTLMGSPSTCIPTLPVPPQSCWIRDTSSARR